MAETLGVAASIVGIASLAGQICSGVQQLYAVVDSIRHAPSDFQNIKNDILLIERVVRRMAEDCTELPEHLDIDLLKCSFELCLSRVNRLLTSIQSFDTPSQKNRTIKLIKATVKKTRVAEFAKELDSAKMTLMLVYQHHIQKMGPLAFSQSSCRSTGNTERIEQENFTTQMVNFSRSYSNTSEAVYTLCLGSLSVKSQSVTLRPAIRKSDAAQTEYRTEKKTFTLRSAEWLSSRIIELQAVRQGSQWTFNLRPWQVVSPDSMLFDFCREGDLRNVQRLFTKGLASPFDVTPDGDTALHFAALSGNPDLVAFLLYNGADANVENTSGRNALHLAMISPREEEHLELARLLVEKGQVDPMGSVREFGLIHSYAGPVDAFRYLIHQDEFLVDLEERNRGGKTILQHQIFHRLYYGDSFERIQVLFGAGHHLPGNHIDGDPTYDGYSALHCAAHVWATAKLREDEHTARQSELVLRSLLSRGEDIHRVSRRGYTVLTTIGEMIHFSRKGPELHQDVIAAWLNMLSEAGHDVKAYCLMESTFERRRRLETPREDFHVIFEEIDGVEGVDSLQISISSLEQVIEVEDDDEEPPKIESTRASSSPLTRSFRERPTGVILPKFSVSLGLTKTTVAIVTFMLFLYCFFVSNRLWR
ncbi:putative ankyrin repeat protein RF_0381 [Aspergillus udagawae]|nr:putative ankyrin repeat protein RF_0381 [Aspergillus udagawae]